jgi:hypothetical protein
MGKLGHIVLLWNRYAKKLQIQARRNSIMKHDPLKSDFFNVFGITFSW